MTVPEARPGERLNAELAECRRQFESARKDAEKLLAGLTDAQFNWRPAAGRWSIGECLEHLNAGYGALPRFDRVIPDARSRGWVSQGPFRHGWLGNLYVRLMEPPPKIRVKTPKRYAPAPDRAFAEVAPRFLALQEELIRRLRDANGLDLARIKMSSPISRRFKLSLGQWFAFLAAHERRHLWQAWQVRRHPEFPAR